MNYGQEVQDIVQETGSKTIPKNRKCKKSKRWYEEALQIVGGKKKKKRRERQKRKGKI